MDPPYMLTTGSYNDGKRGFHGWNLETEQKLFDFIDNLNENGNKFMISYVLEHGGKFNTLLESWITERNYKLIQLEAITGISGSKRKEVLIVNYD
jgi:adenine-specific DNA-methyltransferase